MRFRVLSWQIQTRVHEKERERVTRWEKNNNWKEKKTLNRKRAKERKRARELERDRIWEDKPVSVRMVSMATILTVVLDSELAKWATDSPKPTATRPVATAWEQFEFAFYQKILPENSWYHQNFFYSESYLLTYECYLSMHKIAC